MNYLLYKPLTTQKHVEYQLMHKIQYNDNPLILPQYTPYINEDEEEDDTYLKQRLSSCLSINNFDILQDELLNHIYYEDRYESYDYLNYNEFKEYFKHNGIDIPSIFRKSKSVINVKNDIPFLKLINVFMRHGLKLKTIITLSKVLDDLQFQHLNLINRVTNDVIH